MWVRFAATAGLLALTGAVGIHPAFPAPSSTALTYALISTGTSKIPAFTTAGEDVEVITQLYDALLQVDAEDPQGRAGLATGYTVSRDGRTWTFSCTAGVKWQRGYGEFTCADVQFTWALNKDPDTHSFWQTQASTVDSVTCPDPYTAVFHLHGPFQGFLWNVVNVEPSTGWVLSKAAWDKLGRAGYDKTPVGTGPYLYQSIAPGQEQTLVRNPDYWGARPGVDTIVFPVVADSQTAALAVKSGAMDIYGAGGTLDPVTAATYSHDPGMRLITKPAFFIDYLMINPLVKPFDNVKVREAMRDAIDYKGLVQLGISGIRDRGLRGDDAARDGRVRRVDQPANVYAPAKARALLQEAGVPLPIRGFFTTYNDTKDVNIAQFIAANFSAVGIELQARPLERGTLVQMRIQPDTPASVFGTILTTDPDSMLVSYTSPGVPPAGLNIARYNRVDALYTQQHSALTQADRIRALKQAQQRLATDVPIDRADSGSRISGSSTRACRTSSPRSCSAATRSGR